MNIVYIQNICFTSHSNILYCFLMATIHALSVGVKLKWATLIHVYRWCMYIHDVFPEVHDIFLWCISIKVSPFNMFFIQLHDLKCCSMLFINYTSNYSLLIFFQTQYIIDAAQLQYISRSGQSVYYVLLCFGWVNFTHILQGYVPATGAIRGLPQCQGINPEGYG